MEKDKRNYKILVIEDNLGDYTLIEDYLFEQILSPTLFHAKDYKEVKILNLTKEDNYDVVLLDLSLPDKSGESLIIEIINLFIDCPIIVLTGYDDFSFGVKSLSLGISDYLLKDELNSTYLYKNIIYNIERKKTSLVLEESERRYSNLFHLSPEPMWVYDLESLRFLDINNSAIRHYGFSLEEFLSITIKDIESSEAEIGKDSAFYTQNEGLNPKVILNHKKKNGTLIKVEMHSTQLFFNGKNAHLVLANDITERFEYIQTIEIQNEKLKEIAWIQSHLVRAPLARMMGLIDILRNHGITELESHNVLDSILESADEFDKIIKAITSKAERI